MNFYNPELNEGNKQIPTLTTRCIIIEFQKVRVGLGTTVQILDTFLEILSVKQGTNATGNLVGTAGTASGTLTISNAGIGYTPADGSYTFSGVNLVTLSGNGRGAQADISVKDGVAVGATISKLVDLDIKLVMFLELLQLVLHQLEVMQDLL
jgi:hypothetical protein